MLRSRSTNNDPAVFADSVLTRGNATRPSVFADGVLTSGSANIPAIFADGLWTGGQPHAWVELTGGATRTFQVRGTNGATLKVDYGDGSAPDPITLLGTSTDVPISHAYSAGTYRMRIYGDLSGVTHFSNNYVKQDVKSINFAALVNIYSITFHYESDLDNLNSIYGLEITTLRVSLTSVSDISVVATLASLISALLEGNGVSDMSPVANLSSLLNLYLASNNIVDCSTIENLTNLTTIRLQSNSITTLPDSFPAWDSANIQMQNNGAGFPTDECLQKMAASGMTNNTINIAGTNPARTQPDTDAYVATIVGNGNSLTVN